MMNQYEEDIDKAVLPDISQLDNTTILVTGSTGLIGKCLVKMLHNRNTKSSYVIYAGCRDLGRARRDIGIEESKSFKYVYIDVTKPISLDIKFDYIIDAASGASPNQFDCNPVGIMKANIYGVCNLLEYGVRNGIKRFLYVSTGEVYGQGNNELWHESENGFIDQMSLRSAYPSSKRCAETLCVAYAKQYGAEVVVARLCHTYGPQFQEKDNRAYAQFFRNAKEVTPIVLKSTGGQIRSWIYVVDCISAIIYILLKGTDSNAYNVANKDSNATIAQFAQLVGEQSGMPVKFEITTNNNATPIKSALFDTDKIESLGWHPCFSLNDGITHSLNSL